MGEESVAEAVCASPPSGELSVEFFGKLLEDEKIKMVSVCQVWETKLRHFAPEIPEVIQGMIRAAVGQGRQILAERFPQFRDLVERCASEVGLPKVLVSDLQGFWEMIDIQVGDVQNKFSSLAILESKSWRLPLADEEKVSANITSMVPQAKKGRKASSRPGSVSSEGLKDLINQGRRKMQTSKIPKVQVKEDENAEPKAAELSPLPVKTFDGGFFTLSSPATSLLGERRVHSTQTARSVGRKAPVTRSVTASARRTASLLSPFMSRFGKLSTYTREELELPSRCRFLLSDMDNSLNAGTDEVAEDAAEAVVDVVSAMSKCNLSPPMP